MLSTKTAHYYQQKFSKAITWNAWLFIVMNISYTLISTVFFYRLSTATFSLWANVTSIIYIGVLWCDCGLRKAIPALLPTLSNNKQSHFNFFKWIALSQTITGSIGLIILYLVLNTLSISSFIIVCSLCIFFLEMTLSLLQSLFHGLFLNKEYNTALMYFLIGEILIFSISIFFMPTDYILNAYLIYKIIFLLVSNTYNGYYLIKNYASLSFSSSSSKSTYTTMSFISFAGIMWANTTLRSLTERNMLVPFITFTLGAPIANIYKFSNDWALFIQRGIIKSIGTSDISFTAYLNHHAPTSSLEHSFEKLFLKTISLVLPFLLVLSLILCYFFIIGHSSLALSLFLLLVFVYLFEIVLTPYQRILEIQKHYSLLLFAHIPYIFIPLSIFFGINLSFFSLISFISLMRLFTMFIFTIAARTRYNLKIPTIPALRLLKNSFN